jgi:hypothetical protein
MLRSGTSNLGGTRVGEPMNLKILLDVLCTEDILIANESCGWAPTLEAVFYV